MTLLLRDVAVRGRRLDVRVSGDRISAMGPGLVREHGEDVLDGRGGALLPGLVDHHLHVHALAAMLVSTRCGPPDVLDPAALAAALDAAPADRQGWVRGVGYTESVAGDLDAVALDRLHARRPVRVQHRSGALWAVNSAGARALRLDTGTDPGIERLADGTPTGRLWRADTWLRARLPPMPLPDLAPVGAQLAAHGVTSVTDATPDLDPTALHALRHAVATGALPQRVLLLGVPLDTVVDEHRLSTGPYKIVLADSGLPAFPDLVDHVRAAHSSGRAVAAHAVTREALLLLLAALDEAGSHPGDRVEHAALVPDETRADLARRRIAVVTQPGFVTDRGDAFLTDHDAIDLPDLYRCASLLAAGVPLALSSDAPYGPLNPWTVLRAAVERRTRSGALLGPAERLSPAAALDALLSEPTQPGGPARTVTVGGPADLVVLNGAVTDLPTDDNPVHAVIIGGQHVV